MNAIGFDSGNERFGRQTKHLLSPLGIGILVSLALLMGSAPLYAGKPVTKLPKLNSVLCPVLGGTWDLNTCTIGGGAWGQATSDFMIPDDVSLVIQGDGAPPESPTEPYLRCTFVLGFGVTLENAGLIRIETTGDFGFCNLGTLKNSGNLEVANVSPVDVPTWGMFNLATIDNSGTITVRNFGGRESVGIFNFEHVPEDIRPFPFDTILPTITNTGTIVIENVGERSTGILNYGALSNAGNITVSADIVGLYGLSNQGGAFTNEATGTLVNHYGDPALITVPLNQIPTFGVANFYGTMINYGTVINEAVIGTSGWAMLTFGTLNNHGVLFQSDGVLVNYGTVNNWGAIRSDGTPDYPHNQGVCIDLPNEDQTTWGEGC